MWIKIFVLIFLSLTKVLGTSVDSNDGNRQKREITFEQCKKMQIEMIEWRRDFAIVTSIIIGILILVMIILILYCCFKREFFRNRE